VPYRSINYSYLVFNPVQPKAPRQPHPLFADRGLRIALSMALDRRAMLQNVLDSLGTLSYGPFSLAYAPADTTLPQIKYDTVAAGRMLDSLGWRDGNGDGVREQNGRPLRFSLLVPSSSVYRRRYAVLIQEQLRRVGAHVDIEESDPQSMQPRMFAGQYDAMVHTATSDPSPRAIRQTWRSVDPTNRSFNFAVYRNPQVDALMDSALAEFDPARSRAYYRRAYRAIVDDAPVVWLFEVRPHAAVQKRVRTVLGRSDLWWRDLRLWSIPASERIARDRVVASTSK
jgi:peptide/nickel transport system substrate-binding protein